jgi:hypothetical protein
MDFLKIFVIGGWSVVMALAAFFALSALSILLGWRTTLAALGVLAIYGCFYGLIACTLVLIARAIF